MHKHRFTNDGHLQNAAVQDDNVLFDRRQVGESDIDNENVSAKIYEMLISESGYLLVLAFGFLITLIVSIVLLVKKRLAISKNADDYSNTNNGAGQGPNTRHDCHTDKGSSNDSSISNKQHYSTSDFIINELDDDDDDVIAIGRGDKSLVNDDCSEQQRQRRAKGDLIDNDKRSNEECLETSAPSNKEVVKSRWHNSFYRACRLIRIANNDNKLSMTSNADDVVLDLNDDCCEPELLKSTTLRSTNVQIPIETFNDSNTSEYDDTWCDSRQEDSTTFDNANNQTEADFNNTDNNDFVLDADVRKINRSNVELIMMMNQRKSLALENNLNLMNQCKLDRTSRNRGSLMSTYSQTGVLPKASLVEATEKQQTIMRQQQQQQHDLDTRAMLNRTSTSSDQESNDSMSIDSYGSSGIKYPMMLNELDMATIRVSVKRLSIGEPNHVADTAAVAAAAELSKKHDSNNSQQQVSTNSKMQSSISSIAEKLSIRKLSVGSLRQITSIKTPTSKTTSSSSNYCYEVQLIEARNIPYQQSQPSLIRSFSSSNSTTANCQEPRTSGRRASIMNALMPSGSNHRRSSIDGVFARVFKSQQSIVTQQKQPPAANQADASSKAVKFFRNSSLNSQSIDSDTYSIGSLSILDLGCGSEYIQSPISRQQQNGNVVFEPNSMNIICYEHEFPLRVSIYQVDKKGARYTLGHCFISLEDWLSDTDQNTIDSGTSESSETQSVDKEGRKDSHSDEQTTSSRSSTMSDGIRRRSSSCLTGLAALNEQPKVRFTIIERPSTQAIVIDFKLYQTIFDAIK